MGDLLLSQLEGVNACIRVCRANPDLSGFELLDKFLALRDQISVGLSDDVKKTYLLEDSVMESNIDYDKIILGDEE